MRKLLSVRSALLLCVISLGCIYLILGCNREKVLSDKTSLKLSTKIANIKNWWESHKPLTTAQENTLSRLPDGAIMQTYWRSQFQNGIPKWSDARIYTINDETIYEVPFEFPDNLIFLNEKPDASPQYYITGKPGSNSAYKTSQTYLVIKEKPGTTNVAEIMCVVLDNSYVKLLDSVIANYPTIHISNVYPAPNNLEEFTGSIKFYDLNGSQILEEGYVAGTLRDYIQYGRCTFPITPVPGLPTTRTYSVCKWTYVYQQNCGPEAGCTDWILIGVIFNGCETITIPDSPPVLLPGGGGDGTDGAGGGQSFPTAPVVQQDPAIPNADLCGRYTWQRLGDGHTAQIKNLGARFRYTRSDGSFYYQDIILGWVCVVYPKWVTDRGYDISGFVNDAFNKAKRRVLRDLELHLLPGTSSAIQPRFKELMTRYISETEEIYVEKASIAYHNGCEGNVPVSQPKWCPPATQ